jgi:preprotein translocase subunit SecD
MMKKQLQRMSPLVLLTLCVLCLIPACGLPLPFTSSKRQQTKDRGGIRLVVVVKAEGMAAGQSVEQTMSVIRSRCDHLGVFCDVRHEGGEGSNRLALRVSGGLDAERIKRVLLAQGLLELRPVVSPSSPMPLKVYATRAEALAAAGADKDVLPYVAREAEPGEFLVVERTPVITGRDVRDAEANTYSPEGDRDFFISFSLKPEGAARLGSWTGANINRYIAVTLNGQVRSAAFIRGQINEDGQINGNFTKEQAEDVALTLRSGTLPAPVEVLEEGTYKP